MPNNDSPITGIVPGDRLDIRGKHADGSVYRWWTATVESVTETGIVVTWPVGTLIAAVNPKKHRYARRRGRAYFWQDRFYNIIEAYDADGELGAIFADICTPAHIEGHRLTYIDHELDVVKYRGHPAFVEDEDEFEEATQHYGYSVEFQEHCRQVTTDLLDIVEHWPPGTAPEFPDQPVIVEHRTRPVPPDVWP